MTQNGKGNESPIHAYIKTMWGEFTEIRKEHHIAPLILAFSIIEANAKLSAPAEIKGSRNRFIWWIDKFLKNKDGTPYPSLEMYSARCGLFHEYGAESDISRRDDCKVIAWVSGVSGLAHHYKYKDRVLMLSSKQFFDDLYDGGMAMLKSMVIDREMAQRFESRLPELFGVFGTDYTPPVWLPHLY